MIQKVYKDVSHQRVTYVRPIVEFSDPVWCPKLKSDLALLEDIQYRATYAL